MGELRKLTKLLENFEKIKSEVIDGIGEIAVSEFTLNFRKQGFNGNTWTKKKKPNGKNILVGRGTLRRSIKVLKKSNESVTVGSDVPYALIHNNGGTIKHDAKSRVLRFTRKNGRLQFAKSNSKRVVAQSRSTFKAYTINMPKRQFIGDMPSLTKKITNFIKRKFDRL